MQDDIMDYNFVLNILTFKYESNIVLTLMSISIACNFEFHGFPRCTTIVAFFKTPVSSLMVEP